MAQRNFPRNINLLNILLIGAILIFANYTILPLLNMSVRFMLPTGMKHHVHNDEKAAESIVSTLTDYTVIADENLFHPERKIPVETAEEQVVPKPEFILLGTVITGDTKLAYLENLKEPYTTEGRGRRQRSLRIGDTLNSYTLAEVYPEKVVMVRGADRIEVRLNDSRSRTPRSRETTQETEKTTPQPSQANGRIRKIQGAGHPPGVVHGDRPQDVPEPDSVTTSRAKESFIEIFRKKQGEQAQGKQ